MDNYLEYRGKCKELSEELVKNDPSLRLVRGHYWCPSWGKQAHWWCEKEDGTIVDPSALQFPSKGSGYYEEFNGMVECSECGKMVREEDAQIVGNGHYAVCSGFCYRSLIGV